MGHLVSSLALYVLALQPLAIEEKLPLVEDIVTEEAFAETYVNYQAAPETIKYQPIIEKKNLQELSQISLIIDVNKVSEALQECKTLRHLLENEIGDRPGSYSINKTWIKKYQNCALARREDIKRIEQKIRYLQNRIAREDLNASITSTVTKPHLMIQLQKRVHEIKKETQAELNLQKGFVRYFNTGKKMYAE